MSQVKNLRAMFETKGDTSPPDRGRSLGITPGRQMGDASSNGSPRPLSKVRTNFVAIEKDGRMGLRRDHSDESSLSRRRMSIETADTSSNGNHLDNPNAMPSDDVGKASRRNVASETILESPRTMSHDEQAGVPPVRGGSELNKAHIEAKNKLDSPPPPLSEQTGTGSVENTEFKSASATNCSPSIKHKGHSSVKAKMTTTMSVPMSNTGAISAARPESKATTRGLKISKSSADRIQKVNTGATSSTKTRTVPPGVAKIQPLKTKSQNDAVFVKPKPKSPTKPVQMPSSLTAPTASSVSKAHVPCQSLSRQSGTQNSTTQPILRSNTSNSTVSLSATKGRGSSSKSRPSLGPPPSKQSQVTASQKRPSNVDEGFLARMMRPTQSSSSKATDKAPITPPKRTAQRPVGGEHGNHAISRSASSKGFHSKSISVLTPLESTSAPLTGSTNGLGSLKSEEEGNEVHIDTKNRSQIVNVYGDAGSSSNPATQCNTKSAMDDLANKSHTQEEADDFKASLAARPTPPVVELTEASATIGSDEPASQDKLLGAVEELEDAAPETISEQQNCEADLVPETGEILQGSAGDNLANEESVTAEGYRSSGLVEADPVEQHTPETSVVQLDINHSDEQTIEQVIRSTQNYPLSEVNGPSSPEIKQADLGADKREELTKLDAALHKQNEPMVQDQFGTVEVVTETEHAGASTSNNLEKTDV